MEPNEPLLLPPFSEEEALKRDVFQDLFALYESRILPPAKSDEEVIERIGEAFTIKKVDDPTADQEWAIRLSEEKRVRYATPRFQIYKIVRDEKSALFYDNAFVKDGNFLSIIYDTQDKRFIDEDSNFIFLLRYYPGLDPSRKTVYTRAYVRNLWMLNQQKAILQQIQKEERMARRHKPETEFPEEVRQTSALPEAAAAKNPG